MKKNDGCILSVSLLPNMPRLSSEPNAFSGQHYPSRFGVDIAKRRYNARELARLLRDAPENVHTHFGRALTPKEKMRINRRVPRESPRMSNNVNLISLEHFPAHFGIRMNGQVYNARSLAGMMKKGIIFKKVNKKLVPQPPRVPHSRRPMTQEEIERIHSMLGMHVRPGTPLLNPSGVRNHFITRGNARIERQEAARRKRANLGLPVIGGRGSIPPQTPRKARATAKRFTQTAAPTARALAFS